MSSQKYIFFQNNFKHPNIIFILSLSDCQTWSFITVRFFSMSNWLGLILCTLPVSYTPITITKKKYMKGWFCEPTEATLAVLVQLEAVRARADRPRARVLALPLAAAIVHHTRGWTYTAVLHFNSKLTICSNSQYPVRVFIRPARRLSHFYQSRFC